MHYRWEKPERVFLLIPRRVNGKWRWLRRVWRWGHRVNGFFVVKDYSLCYPYWLR